MAEHGQRLDIQFHFVGQAIDIEFMEHPARAESGVVHDEVDR